MSAPSAIGVVSGDFLSAQRLNRMLVHVMTGAEMVSYSPKYDGMVVVCSLTGSGFTRMFTYIWDATVGQFKGSSGGKHTHDVDDEASGGLLANIFRANLNKAFFMDMATPSIGDFHIVKSGSASESNDLAGGRVLFATGTTNASYVHGMRSGLAWDLSKPIDLGFKGYMDAGVRMTVKMGICMENVNDAPSDASKLGIEACDTAGTAKKWDVVSATGAGSSRTVSTAPSENVSQAGPRFYKLLFTPGSTLTFAVNGGAPEVTKSGNIPGSGRTSHIGTYSIGVRANEGVNKQFRFYAARIAGTVSDLNWF